MGNRRSVRGFALRTHAIQMTLMALGNASKRFCEIENQSVTVISRPTSLLTNEVFRLLRARPCLSIMELARLIVSIGRRRIDYKRQKQRGSNQSGGDRSSVTLFPKLQLRD